MRMDFFRRLHRDERGVSAIEFALIAPMLIFLYFGMVEFCQGYMAQRRSSQVAATVADLVAQTDTTSKKAVQDIFAGGELIMQPFPLQDRLKQRVSSVTRVSPTQYKVDWSLWKGMSGPLPVAQARIPDTLVAVNESVIVAEAEYDYYSPIGYVMPGATRFSRRSLLKPRTSDVIPCTDCP